MKKPLTNRQYLNRSGLHCPACGRHSGLCANQPDVNDDPIHIHRRVECLRKDCGAQWMEVFEMTGYVELKDRNGKDIRTHRSA